MTSMAHFYGSCALHRVHSDTFHGDRCTVEDPLVHIAGTFWSEGEAANTLERT